MKEKLVPKIIHLYCNSKQITETLKERILPCSVNFFCVFPTIFLPLIGITAFYFNIDAKFITF